jgi:hypothetical protein
LHEARRWNEIGNNKLDQRKMKMDKWDIPNGPKLKFLIQIKILYSFFHFNIYFHSLAIKFGLGQGMKLVVNKFEGKGVRNSPSVQCNFGTFLLQFSLHFSMKMNFTGLWPQPQEMAEGRKDGWVIDGAKWEEKKRKRG